MLTPHACIYSAASAALPFLGFLRVLASANPDAIEFFKQKNLARSGPNLLPLGETIRTLPDEEALTDILTNNSGKTCQDGSRVVQVTTKAKTKEPHYQCRPDGNCRVLTRV